MHRPHKPFFTDVYPQKYAMVLTFGGAPVLNMYKTFPFRRLNYEAQIWSKEVIALSVGKTCLFMTLSWQAFPFQSWSCKSGRTSVNHQKLLLSSIRFLLLKQMVLMKTALFSNNHGRWPVHHNCNVFCVIRLSHLHSPLPMCPMRRVVLILKAIRSSFCSGGPLECLHHKDLISV